jgi:hypothetical protein
MVDYEEGPVDLFWRAGEHFRLWRCSRVNLLQVALDLGIEDLCDSVHRTVDRTLTLHLHYAYNGESKFLGRTSKTRCRHEKLDLQYRGLYDQEVLFCACVPTGDFLRNCSHVLLSRASTSDSDIRFTLVTRSGDHFRTVKLEDIMLQTLSVLVRSEAEVLMGDWQKHS